MYVKQVVFGLFYLSCCYCIRIWRHKTSCDRPGTGFTCLPKVGDKTTVIFECPSKTRDYHIYINEFSGPRTLENLIIKNCKSLTILLRCTKYAWEKKNLKYLEISHIEKLKFQNVALYQSLLPPTVVFENIKSIENIPSHTFTQTNKKLNLIRCVLPNYTFRSIRFSNVSINTVQAKAFYMPNSFGNVAFTNVKIKTLDISSIIVSQASNSIFLFENSTIEVIKPSAIQIVAHKIVFSKNRFVEILWAGIKVRTDVFDFLNNTVDRQLHGQGLSVTSQRILVSSNHFKHLKTGALSRMSGSENQLGSYEFVGNVMDFLEDDSLLPKLSAYKNISLQTTIKRNTFSCECYQSGSLLSKIEKKTRHATTDEFYKKIFDKRSENVCSSTCNLPIFEAKGKIINEKCTNSITVTGICTARKIIEIKLITSAPKTSTLPSIYFRPSISSSFNESVKIDRSILRSNTTILPTTQKIITFGPTTLLPIKKTSVNMPSSPETPSSISFRDSINNKSISARTLIKNITLPSIITSPTVPQIRTSSSKYTTSTFYYPSETASFKRTYLSSNNDLFTLTSTKEKLSTKKASSPLPEVISSTVTSVDDTSLSSSITSTVTVTSNEEDTPFSSPTTSTVTVTSNEEDTSPSSLKTSSFILLQTSTNNDSPTEDTTTSTSTDLSIIYRENSTLSLETSSVYNLTTATVSATTIPTTKYKAAASNDSVKVFTREYNDIKPILLVTSTPKQFSTPFHKEFAPITTTTTDKWIENSSKCYVLFPWTLFFLVTFALNVL